MMTGSSWRLPAAAGAIAFWVTNLVISLTPIAAQYRTAMSITYVPMLLEAAVGGALVAVVVARVLARFPRRVPGAGPLGKALWLSAAALILLTLLVEVPSKLRSGVANPGLWSFVATVFNVIRVLALGLAIGLVARAGQSSPRADPPSTEQEGQP